MASGGLEWMRSVFKRRIAAVEFIDSGTGLPIPGQSVGGGSGSVTAATLTKVDSLATNIASAVALNTARRGLSIFNTDANALLVKFGATASATSFTVRIPQNGFYEMDAPVYTGRIDFIWEADGAGSAYVTER